MCLNEYGSIVCREIYKTPLIRENVIIDEFVVMPNHVHLILVIGNIFNNNVDGHRRGEATPRLYRGDYPNMSKISPKPNSLSSIIGSLKSVITKRIHQIGLIDFKWQSRFHDHIIRNENVLNKIRRYVQDNPAKWDRDRNNIWG